MPLRSMALVAAAAMVAGCPNTGTGPALDVSPSPSTAASVTPAPSAAPSSVPTATPSGSASASTAPTPAPSVSAPAPSGATVTVNGAVFNEEGAKVDGVTVTVKSLTANAPFSATLTTTNGHYVVNGVPVGAQIQFVATKAGFTSRTIVDSFQTNDSNAKAVNFGNSDLGAANAAFFISDYPEMVSATAGDSTNGQKLNYVLKFSEAFDETNRRRIEDAVSVTATARPGTTSPIVIRKGSTFLDASKRLEMNWNAAGDTLTLTFDAPLQALNSAEKAYSVGFSRPTGAEVIKDNNSKVFGFVSPDAGQPYATISKKANLAIASTDNTATKRWTATHSRTSSFDVVKDDVRAKLESVLTSVVTVGGKTYQRFELTFNEPMVVYPDATGFSNTIKNVNNYTLVFSKKTDGTRGIDMDRTAVDRAATGANIADLTNLTASMDSEAPFRVVGNATSHPDNAATISFSNSNPRVVRYDLPKALIPSELKVVRFKVNTDVLDPAGNRTSETGKDTNTLTADNVKDGII